MSHFCFENWALVLGLDQNFWLQSSSILCLAEQPSSRGKKVRSVWCCLLVLIGVYWCLVGGERGVFPNELNCIGQRQNLFKELKILFEVVGDGLEAF